MYYKWYMIQYITKCNTLRGVDFMEWNIKDINNIVNFINSKLNNGFTMKEIEMNDFGVNARVIHKRLIRQGYRRIGNKYIKNETNVKQSVIQNVLHKEKSIKNHNVVEVIDVLEESCNTENYDKLQVQKNLLDLAKEYEIIKDMINSFKENNKLLGDVNNNLVIELPYEPSGKDFGTSIRVNKVIWNEFNEVANKYKQFTKKELISQALKEFIQKYNYDKY